MASALLLFHVILGFVAGWLLVALVTSIADLFGTGRAGFAGSVPSVGAVSLLLIGASQSSDAAVKATAIFPLAFGVTFTFLLFYAFPNRLTFWPRIIIAYLLWAFFAMLLAVSGFDNFYLSLGGGLVLSSLVYLLCGSRGIKDVPSDPREVGLNQVVLRGALGGCVVGGVVALSAISGPLAGAVLGSAPTIWPTSLYVANRTHGMEFSRSLTKSFLRAGLITIIPYYAAARFLFLVFGIWLGTLLAYVAISPLAWLSWRLSNQKRAGLK